MSDETLLSDLCSICNTNKSKYRCPGCSARTCSLPCYKRHQQWAQCSGKRDPTKFVKKSQLVTPAGIDHDYNFLTGIERDIEIAEKGLDEHGESAQGKSRSWSQKGQINYQQLEAAGVKVIRAPKGLSRQKENKSHRSSTKKSTGGRNIMWTVEWLDDQKRRMLTETSSTAQIVTVQPFAHREQHKVKKRKRNSLDPEPPSTSDTTSIDPQDASHSSPDPNKSVKHDVEVINSELQPSGGLPKPDEQPEQHAETNLADTHHADSRNDGPNTQPMGNGNSQFFLVMPRTSSSRQVLIPLNASATLGECLQGRTVLEFPTIYVFPSSMDQLPDEFMLEQDYVKQEGEEQKEFDELIKELDPEILKRLNESGPAGRRSKEEEVDSREILDVLKKDFPADL